MDPCFHPRLPGKTILRFFFCIFIEGQMDDEHTEIRPGLDQRCPGNGRMPEGILSDRMILVF